MRKCNKTIVTKTKCTARWTVLTENIIGCSTAKSDIWEEKKNSSGNILLICCVLLHLYCLSVILAKCIWVCSSVVQRGF